MGAEHSWVDGLRAESLATIVLTRHDGVDVIPVARVLGQSGYDLLVRIKDQHAGWEAEFAVEIQGTRKNLATTGITLTIPMELDVFENIDLPLVLFLFDVEREDGFYHWLKEPVIESDGKGTLRLSLLLSEGLIASRRRVLRETDLQELTDSAIADILCQVVNWYEVRAHSKPSPALQTQLA